LDEENLEFKKNSSVKIVLEKEKKDSEHEENHEIVLWNNISNRSYTPNYSDPDQKHIKSFSILKDRSKQGCVVSKFKAPSESSKN